MRVDRSARSRWATRQTGLELIDLPVESVSELEENLREIAAINRFLGGTRTVLRAIAPYSPETLLDVGSGIADIPRAIARWARGRNLNIRITALDSNPRILEIARQYAGADPAIAIVAGDGTALPFDDASFDVVTCNLTLHHCDPPAARALLAQMRRVARRAVVVTDLRRSRAVWLGAGALALLSRNRLTRHDAPLSVLRAYTESEALALARESGWRRPRVRRAAFYRMVMTDA